jgi:hypothetical protein
MSIKMTRHVLGFLGILTIGGPLTAEVVDTATYQNVLSVSFLGDPANELTFFETTVTAPFTLGAISWDGAAVSTENAGATGDDQFPTFGSELSVRITHDNSGAFADVALGIGSTFGPEPMQFTGSSFGLTGTLVNPGDGFSFEFFEGFDDPEVNPDAVWNSISLRFHDDTPGADVIRFDTTGAQPWPTDSGEPGAEFYGVEYGAGGAGPSITNIRLEGHDFFTFWFDLRTDLGIEDGGQFRANRLRGVSEPQAFFSDEDPTVDAETGERLFANTFGTLDLSFEEGDFGPGDLIRFGVLTRNDEYMEFTSGDQMAQLQNTGPLTITVTFDDGTAVTGPLIEANPDLPRSARVDLSVLDRARPSGGDTDADGDVDGNDLMRAFLGLGTRFGALQADGDVDGQGDVDDDDLLLVASNLGLQIVRPVSGATTAAVPEPSACVLLLLGMAGVQRYIRFANVKCRAVRNFQVPNAAKTAVGG